MQYSPLQKKHETRSYWTADIKVSYDGLLFILLALQQMHCDGYNHLYLFETSSNKCQVKYLPPGVLKTPLYIHRETYLRWVQSHTHKHYLFLPHTADKARLNDLSLTHTVSLLSWLELTIPFVIQTDSFTFHCCLNDVFN